MTDPISGTAASQMAEQAKQVGGEDAAVGDSDSASKASFGDVLSDVQSREVEQTQGVDQADKAQQVDGVEAVEKAQEAEGPAADRLRGFLDGMSTDETKIDEMMSKSLNGEDMSQQDLLQMQALMYSYSQKVELTTKAVSNAASGMKQIMNTQV